MLRWKQFVQGDIESFMASTKKFTELTGIKVRVDTESWEDVRPKAAVAANVGAGPDIIIGTNDDPFKFPEKLVDLTDLADYLGGKYGGWYDTCRAYGTQGKRWIALPQGVNGSCINYRISAVKKAGFETIPEDLPGFLKLCQGLKATGTPAGFALGHATGDANNWTHWCLWTHGGKVVDTKSNVVLNSPETVAALEYAKQLADTFIQGTLSWQDPSNNKAFLAGEHRPHRQRHLDLRSGQELDRPGVKGDRRGHGPCALSDRGGQALRLSRTLPSPHTSSIIPNSRRAAKEYLRFMWEADQYNDWLTSLERLHLAAAQGLRQEPDLDRRSEDHAVPRRRRSHPGERLCRSAGLRLGGGDGRFHRRRHVRRGLLGNAVAAAAASRAAERAKRYYQV